MPTRPAPGRRPIDIKKPEPGVKELLHRRGRHERVFRNPDGTITVVASGAPLNRRDEQGKWVPREFEFRHTAGQKLRVDTGDYSALLPGTAAGPLRLEVEGKPLSMRAIGVSESSRAVVSQDGSRVTYPEAWRGTDLVYVAEPSGLKELIILHGPDSVRAFEFALIGPGIPVEPVIRPVVFRDEQGRPIDPPEGAPADYLAALAVDGLEIPRVNAFDASGAQIGLDWLFDEDTQRMRIEVPYVGEVKTWPVTIDPTVNTTAATVYEGSTTTITVPGDATSLTSAFIRFTALSNTTEQSTSSSSGFQSGGSASVSVPSASGGKRSTGASNARNDDSVSRSVTASVSGLGTSGSNTATLGPGGATSASVSGSYSPGSSISASGSSAGSVSTLAAATSYYDVTAYSSNPNARVGTSNWVNPTSVSANSPGATANSTLGSFTGTTSWFVLPGFALGTNTLSHKSGQSFGHQYEVQYTYEANSAPYPPTSLTRANFDATASALFAWQFQDAGDTPSAFQLVILRAADGVTVHDTGKTVSVNSNYTLTPATLSNNVQYQWKVKTWDAADQASAYSELATFWTSAKPAATVTSPSVDGEIISVSNLTLTWTTSDTEGEGQSAYQARLTDGSDVVLWDSGKTSGILDRSATASYVGQNGANYKWKLTVWDAKDVPGDEVVRTFSISFTPPATPTHTVVPDADRGCNWVTVQNPTPSGSQPNVSYNDLHRREDGETDWTRIATNMAANGTYKDYAVPTGATYQYKVTAVGANGTTADSAVRGTELRIPHGFWLHSVDNPAETAHFFQYRETPLDDNRKLPTAEFRFAGRSGPVVQIGAEQLDRNVRVRVALPKDTTDRESLEALFAARSTLCFRDFRGRVVFGVLPELPITDEKWGGWAEVNITAVDYSEVV